MSLTGFPVTTSVITFGIMALLMTYVPVVLFVLLYLVRLTSSIYSFLFAGDKDFCPSRDSFVLKKKEKFTHFPCLIFFFWLRTYCYYYIFIILMLSSHPPWQRAFKWTLPKKSPCKHGLPCSKLSWLRVTTLWQAKGIINHNEKRHK